MKIINKKEIEFYFRDYCWRNKIKFSKEKFRDFLKFLKIDFYDWIRENLRQFNIHK